MYHVFSASIVNWIKTDRGAFKKYPGLRPGVASDEHGCATISEVPTDFRQSFYLGISQFYQKYTHAYGIPILGELTMCKGRKILATDGKSGKI